MRSYMTQPSATNMATPHRIQGLYVIIDPDACGDRSPVDVARGALEGGANILQWRDKRRDKGEQIADAHAIAQLCSERGAHLIINDHADLVTAAGAHGVHLGQHDLPFAAARALLGPDAIIGVSTNNAAEALAAEAGGADYVAVGAIFPTSSKEDTRPANLDRIRAVKAAVNVPVVAIGGINADNIVEVIAAGADAAAVISAVCSADDATAAAATLASAFASTSVRNRRADLRAIIEEFVDTLNRRDRAAFIALFAPDGIIQDPIDESPHIGHEAIGLWWDALITLDNEYDVRLETSNITGEEAAILWTIAHKRDGEIHHARGVEILSFDGDLIASCHSYWSRSKTTEPAMQNLATQYIRAVGERDGAAFLALFAPEAVQQDPVGTPPRIGHAAIRAWWDDVTAIHPSLAFSIDHVCVAGNELAIAWRAKYEDNGARTEGVGVDILGIDSDGKIASAHSYWESDEAPWVEQVDDVDRSAWLEGLRNLADRFIEVLNKRDRDEFLGMFAEDCVAQVPYHEAPFIGIDGLARWWDHAMPHSQHDLRLDSAYAVRDDVAIVWTDLDQSPGTITAARGIEVLTSHEGLLSAVTSFRPLRDVDDQRPYAMAEAYVAAINAGNRESFLALWSEHGMRQDPPGMIPMIGIEAIGQVFDQMLIRFANHSVSIETICVAGNEAAIATRVEDRDGTTPPFSGVIVLALDSDGKIASLHGYWDA